MAFISITHILFIYIVAQCTYSAVLATCPNKAAIRSPKVHGGTQFGGRSLHQECCLAGRRQCKCNFGLECCRNVFNDRICIDNPCGSCNNGRCLARNGHVRCVCNQGFVMNRNVCTRRGSSPARVQPRGGGGISGLLTGFFGPRRRTGAVDVLLCHNNPCAPGGTCSVVRGQVACRCSRGFVLNRITKRCEDPNQFTTAPPLNRTQPVQNTTQPGGLSPVITLSIPVDATTTPAVTDPRCSPNPCGANKICTIESNIVICHCPTGLALLPDGTCFLNPCLANPCTAQEGCTFTPGVVEHECVCLNGLIHNADNECADPSCARTCGRNTNCVIENGNPVCTCKPGFFLSSTLGCVNSTCDNLCGPNQLCNIGNNVAICGCKPGFTPTRDGACLDPCIPNPCGANKACSIDLTTTSIKCDCATGFLQAADGSCFDNPCEPDPCGTGGTCSVQQINNICSCSPGFILHNNTCIDNPCEPNPCGVGGTCSLDGASSRCSCLTGFIPHNNTCIDNPCDPDPCGIGGICVMHESGLSNCSCFDNFTMAGGDGSCISALDNPCLSNNPCGLGGVCTAINSTAICRCNEGFTLQSNGTCEVAPPTTASLRPIQIQSTPSPCGRDHPCGIGTCSLVDGEQVCTCPVGFHKINSTTCVVSNPCDPLTTRSTLHLGDEGSTTIPRGRTTGCLKSRNYPNVYHPSKFDEVELPVEGRTTLHIIIEHLETQPTQQTRILKVNTCRTDFLFVRGQLFCGFISKTHQPASRQIDVTGLKTIMMGFIADSRNEFNGFILRWILT